MQLYVSSEAVYNSKYEEAQRLTRQRALVKLNSFAIVLQANNGRGLPESEFQYNQEVMDSIANGVKMNFYIQYVDAPENPTSEAVPNFEGFINVGQHLKWVKDMQPNTSGAIARMIENDYPGSSYDEIAHRLDGMPGVSVARNDAVTDAWNGQS